MGEKSCRRPCRLRPRQHHRRSRVKTKKPGQKAKKILTGMRKTKTTRADKARRPWISHPCRGVSPRRSYASHTSPGLPTFATSGVPESRASKVIRRRAFSGFTIRKLVEHVALRRVVPRSAAQRLDGGTDHSSCSAAERGGVVAARRPLPRGGLLR